MGDDALEQKLEGQQSGKLKCYTRAAIAGALVALSGSCAYCVYDGYTRMHQDLCDCAIYGTMVTSAFSHPIVAIGAAGGIAVLSGAYLLRHAYRGCKYHFGGGLEKKVDE